jgi:2'-5' RNA ligase
VGGAGAFPGWTRPRVLWLGLTSHAPGTGEGADPPANDALARLYHAVDSTCAALGLGRESRPFRAHLTLGRVRPGARPDIGALRAVGAALPTLPAFPIRTLDLMASELAPTGAIHTCLAALPLAGAPHEPGAAAPGAR